MTPIVLKNIPENFAKFEVQKIHTKKLPKSLKTERAVARNNSDTDLQDLDEQIDKMVVRVKNDGPARKDTGKKYGTTKICKVCGKEGNMATIRNHIEAKHITGGRHTCDLCGKILKTRNSLGAHKSTFHRVINIS